MRAAVEAVKVVERVPNRPGKHPGSRQEVQTGLLIARRQAHPGPAAELSGKNLTELACRHHCFSGSSNRAGLTGCAVKNKKRFVGEQESEIG
ncbi:hypothetical protein OEIGOIKO_03550 [Streptomyces chrestomyceticus JCM 4735]|uniref:Uncharacterized protein n=1 Tax=Streptomyces chrestomyceticus JCM 4735 TaxID=1306181 RepID=A0A7U9KW08_9ACTN|nr:hypothetical protein OEIGOIKO_03550 [Streptomyces chrestomyceticus JCM 4735]